MVSKKKGKLNPPEYVFDPSRWQKFPLHRSAVKLHPASSAVSCMSTISGGVSECTYLHLKRDCVHFRGKKNPERHKKICLWLFLKGADCVSCEGWPLSHGCCHMKMSVRVKLRWLNLRVRFRWRLCKIKCDLEAWPWSVAVVSTASFHCPNYFPAPGLLHVICLWRRSIFHFSCAYLHFK